MINYIQYRRKLRKLYQQRKNTNEYFKTEIAKAKANNESREKIQEIDHEAYFELQQLDEEMRMLATRYLGKEANKLMVPMPEQEDDSMWKKSGILANRYFLTTKGINTIRAEIRKEKNERFELFFKYTSLIIGILGTLTALFSVI